MYHRFVRVFACATVGLALSALGFAQTDKYQTDQQKGSKSSAAAKSGQSKSSKSGSGSGMTQSSGMSESKSGQLSASDKQFLTKAAQGGMAEVELGQLAQEKSQDPKVKEFGQRMVTDHGKANEELKSLAGSKGVTLPAEPGDKEKAEKERLSKLSGEQFDRAYMKHMVKDHTKDVSEFRKEAQAAKDNDVKQFASSTLPTLEDHLKQAKSIAPKERAAAKSGMASETKSGRTKGNNTSASNPPQQ